MRPWIVTALVVAVAVGIFLLATAEPEPTVDPGPRAPRAPSPLSEREVRTYITVAPDFYRIFQQEALRFQAGRVAEGGGPGTPGASQSRIDGLLQTHNLSRAAWTQLMGRVEYAVNAVRARREADDRHARIEEELDLKRSFLDKTTGESRELLEREIAKLEEELAWEGPPLSEHDQEMVRRFWADLARIVPANRPPR